MYTFNNFFFHKLLHSKSNQFSIQITSLTSVYTIPQTKKNSKWNFFKIFDENLIGLKLWPEPAALAFQNTRPGQSHHKAIILAWLSLAYLGLAWPGSRPQARPCTALVMMPYNIEPTQTCREACYYTSNTGNSTCAGKDWISKYRPSPTKHFATSRLLAHRDISFLQR